MFSRNNRTQFRKALPVQVSHTFTPESAVFDEDNLVSCAGLVPVMTLAEQTGLSRAARREGAHRRAEDQVGVGQPGSETGHPDRRACVRARTASTTSTWSARAA